MLLDKIIPSRLLSKALNATKRLLSERGESNAASMALDLIATYNLLSDEQKDQFFRHLAEKFNPEPANVLAAAQAYASKPSAEHLIALSAASESPRQELLRRLNRAPSGTKTIIDMRHHLLKTLHRRPELKALDADMAHLLGSWFNAGFLKMHQVDWRSPAHILEKIIQYEAVHAIDGWDDLRRRLQPDRRCFAFFHPQLPDEPLIFVEVALLPEIPGSIGPLVDKKSPTLTADQFKCAIFYSISNCQPGLRGVSMGNFLIKRVAETLQKELPSLRSFCTLSPVPAFMDWVCSGAPLTAQNVRPAWRARHQASVDLLGLRPALWNERVTSGWRPDTCSEDERAALQSLCTLYLLAQSTQPGGNPVAKFHLGNGARLHRVNWAADLSRKGIKQSAGLMVNYLYDLDKVEVNHELFVTGEVSFTKSVTQLI